MTVTLALPKLFDDVVAKMASWAGVRTALERVSWGVDLDDPFHYSTPSLSGTPTAAAEVRVRFPTGGTVGVAGITYQTSLDDGTTWGALTALGTGTTVVVLGVTLTLGAGDVEDASVVRWTQTSPDVVPHRFGWREPAKHEGARRIVWVPGDELDAGPIEPARNPGRNPRPLWTLLERVTVLLEAVDQSTAEAAENERAQYVAARLLFDAWARAVYLVAHQTVEILEVAWMEPRGPARRFGATLRVVLSVQAQIPDALQTTASTSTVADVHTTAVVEDDEERDQTDEETVSPTDTP